jgi:hypothetical protein
MSVLRLGFAAGSIALITGITLVAQEAALAVRGPDCGNVIARDGLPGVWLERRLHGLDLQPQDHPVRSVCRRLRG